MSCYARTGLTLPEDIKMLGACGFEPQTATRVKVVWKAFHAFLIVKTLIYCLRGQRSETVEGTDD